MRGAGTRVSVGATDGTGEGLGTAVNSGEGTLIEVGERGVAFVASWHAEQKAKTRKVKIKDLDVMTVF